jgi:hypothetical protein
MRLAAETADPKPTPPLERANRRRASAQGAAPT